MKPGCPAMTKNADGTILSMIQCVQVADFVQACVNLTQLS